MFSKAGVDTGQLVIRGGTHYEYSFIPTPTFGATRRGIDLAAWYTTAWFDRYVKDRPTGALGRLLSDGWRHDAVDRRVDPEGRRQPAEPVLPLAARHRSRRWPAGPLREPALPVRRPARRRPPVVVLLRPDRHLPGPLTAHAAPSDTGSIRTMTTTPTTGCPRCRWASAARARAAAAALPRGPRGPALVQSAALMRFRHQFVPWLRRRYGDVFDRQAAARGASAGAVQPDVGDQGDLRQRPRDLPCRQGQRGARPDHGRALAAARRRRAAQAGPQAADAGLPARPRWRATATVVTQLARDEVAVLARPATEFRSLERMNALTLEVILRVVFGVADEDRLARAAPAGQRHRRRQADRAARLGLPGPAEVRPVEEGRRGAARARPRCSTPRSPSAGPPTDLARAHRRALPAAAGRRDARARRRSPTPSCATSSSRCCSPATRRPRPGWRGRSTSSAAHPELLAPGAAGGATRATTTTSRR